MDIEDGGKTAAREVGAEIDPVKRDSDVLRVRPPFCCRRFPLGRAASCDDDSKHKGIGAGQKFMYIPPDAKRN